MEDEDDEEQEQAEPQQPQPPVVEVEVGVHVQCPVSSVPPSLSPPRCSGVQVFTPRNVSGYLSRVPALHIALPIVQCAAMCQVAILLLTITNNKKIDNLSPLLPHSHNSQSQNILVWCLAAAVLFTAHCFSPLITQQSQLSQFKSDLIRCIYQNLWKCRYHIMCIYLVSASSLYKYIHPRYTFQANVS